MAKVSAFLLLFTLVSSSSVFLAAVAGGDEADGVFSGRPLDRRMMGLSKKKEKFSHFRFYWHDVFTGEHPTSFVVIPPVNGSQNFFGSVNMIDNALTIGPDVGSKLVGRAQGLYAQVDQNTIGLLVAQNFVFTDGKYNGSTITVLGRNHVWDTVREMPVVGGSGLFRFARGYVQAHTHTFDPNSGDATVEYNLYVLHY